MNGKRFSQAIRRRMPPTPIPVIPATTVKKSQSHESRRALSASSTAFPAFRIPAPY